MIVQGFLAEIFAAALSAISQSDKTSQAKALSPPSAQDTSKCLWASFLHIYARRPAAKIYLFLAPFLPTFSLLFFTLLCSFLLTLCQSGWSKLYNLPTLAFREQNVQNINRQWNFNYIINLKIFHLIFSLISPHPRFSAIFLNLKGKKYRKSVCVPFKFYIIIMLPTRHSLNSRYSERDDRVTIPFHYNPAIYDSSKIASKRHISLYSKHSFTASQL